MLKQFSAASVKADIERFNQEWSDVGAKALITGLTDESICFKVLLPWLGAFGERFCHCTFSHVASEDVYKRLDEDRYKRFWDYCTYQCQSQYLHLGGHGSA